MDDLRYFQRVLKLRDEDIEELLTDHKIDLTAPSSPAVVEPQSSPTPQPEQALEAIPLESEKGVDYTKLRDLLAAGDWKGADQETYRRMLEAADREEEKYFRTEDLLEFPCADLKTIDRLWVHSSKGKFGFSVQKKIYVECGAKLDGKYPGDKIWDKFCDRVGWRVNNKYTSYSKVTFDTSAKDAHLPCTSGFESVYCIFSHRDL